MSSDLKVPPAILVNSDESKKSVNWSNTAKQRFIKQHGDIYHIPEGDAHAIPKYDDPLHRDPPTPEEIKTATDSLEEKIKKLKDQGSVPVPPEPKGTGFYDEWID